MKFPRTTLPRTLLFLLAASLLLPPSGSFGGELAAAEVHRLGERMYREGILPSGKPLQASSAGASSMEGQAAACAGCHLRSGLGFIQGQTVIPPVTGESLYQPRKPYKEGDEFVPSIHKLASRLPIRPAYSDETLATLLTTGVDPGGRTLDPAMPRYELDDRDAAILIAYLKTLSAQPSPGVGDNEIRFATVIVEGTDPAEVESMLAPLQFNIERKNSLVAAARHSDRIARKAYNQLGDLYQVRFSLARWVLKGPAATWRAQLDEYYRQEPVFALLGGISNGEWEPVHRFCEDMALPDLFPVVDYPVQSASDRYTLYFSRGVRLEGAAAARYLNGRAEIAGDRPVVQIVRDNRRGRTLADGFRAEWKSAGHAAAQEIVLAAGETLTAERLQSIVAGEKPAALVVWDGASALPALASLPGRADGPKLLLASGTSLGSALWSIPQPLRESLYLTWPYRLPQEDARFDGVVRGTLSGRPLDRFEPRILRQSYITQVIFSEAMLALHGEYNRDFLLDTIDRLKAPDPPLYRKLDLAPGKRYVANSCSIVQLGKGEKPKMETRGSFEF